MTVPAALAAAATRAVALEGLAVGAIAQRASAPAAVVVVRGAGVPTMLVIRVVAQVASASAAAVIPVAALAVGSAPRVRAALAKAGLVDLVAVDARKGSVPVRAAAAMTAVAGVIALSANSVPAAGAVKALAAVEMIVVGQAAGVSVPPPAAVATPVKAPTDVIGPKAKALVAALPGVAGVTGPVTVVSRARVAGGIGRAVVSRARVAGGIGRAAVRAPAGVRVAVAVIASRVRALVGRIGVGGRVPARGRKGAAGLDGASVRGPHGLVLAGAVGPGAGGIGKAVLGNGVTRVRGGRIGVGPTSAGVAG